MLSPDQSASKIEKRKAIGENEETTRERTINDSDAENSRRKRFRERDLR